jgi:hypothetical protein
MKKHELPKSRKLRETIYLIPLLALLFALLFGAALAFGYICNRYDGPLRECLAYPVISIGGCDAGGNCAVVLSRWDRYDRPSRILRYPHVGQEITVCPEGNNANAPLKGP